MGTSKLLLFGVATEIVVTLIGFYWVRDMLKALAIGIDARFANVDRELRRYHADKMSDTQSEV